MAGNSAIPWVAVALLDLQNAQAGALVTAFQSTALGPGQPDPTTQVIADTSDEILGAVGFSGRYTMDASQGNQTPNVIPPNLKNMAVRKIVRLMRGRLEMTLLPDMIEDERTYQRTLGLLRKGEFPVDATNNPSGSNVGIKPGLVQYNCGQPRRFSPCNLWNI